jgi:hypothetical protein
MIYKNIHTDKLHLFIENKNGKVKMDNMNNFIYFITEIEFKTHFIEHKAEIILCPIRDINIPGIYKELYQKLTNNGIVKKIVLKDCVLKDKVLTNIVLECYTVAMQYTNDDISLDYIETNKGAFFWNWIKSFEL